MPRLVLLLSSLLLCLVVSDLHAATFWVATTGNDGNPGTQAQPWRTIRHCADTVPANSVCMVRDGTYTETFIEFWQGNVTLIAENKWGAIILSTAMGVATCPPAIGFRSSNIVVENMWIQTAPGTVPNGCTASTYHIRGWDNNTPTLAGNQSTIWTGGVARGNKTTNTDPVSGAIKMNQDFAIIEDNVTDANLETLDGADQIIRNNTVTVGTCSTGACLNGIVSKGGARNTLIYNNTVTMLLPGSQGIDVGVDIFAFWDPTTNITCYNCVAFNNTVIHQNSGTGNIAFGMGSCENCVLSNNVGINGGIILRVGRNTGQVPPGADNVKSVNPVMLDNILVAGTTTLASQQVNTCCYTGTLTLNFNNFFGFTSGVPAQTNPITGNPLFVNQSTGDFHLQSGSPAINSGTSVTAAKYGGGSHTLNFAKDGVLRPQGVWDLGIYEIGGVAVTKYWFTTGGSDTNTCGQISGVNDPGRYRTWAGTWACMNSGDTFHMKAGTYPFAIRESDGYSVPNGTAAQRTIVEGEGAPGCGMAGSCNTILTKDANALNEAQYITFQNFTVDGLTWGQAECFWFSAQTGPLDANVLLKNMELKNCWGHGVFTQSDFNKLTMDGVNIHHTNRQNGTITGHGCYLEGHDTVLMNGAIHDLNFSQAQNIVGCQIYDSTAGQGNTVDRPIILNMQFYNITGSHALFISGSDATVINSVFRNSLRGLEITGGSASGGCNSGARVYNNTIANNALGLLIGAGGGCTNLTVDASNNLIVGNSCSPTDVRLNGWTYTGGRNGTDCGTLYGPNPVAISPITQATVSTTDMHLRTGTNPAVDSGLNLSTYVTTDIEGVPRTSGGASDLGAYERAVTGTAPAPPTGVTIQ